MKSGYRNPACFLCYTKETLPGEAFSERSDSAWALKRVPEEKSEQSWRQVILARKTTGKRNSTSSAKRSAASGRTGQRRSSAAERQRIVEREERRALIRSEAAVIFVFALSVLLFLSNFGLCGAAGAFLKRVQLGLFGVPGYLFPFFLLISAVYGVSNRDNEKALVKIPAAFGILLMLGGLLHLFLGENFEGWKSAATFFLSGRGGGVLGGLLYGLLHSVFGGVGAFLILTVLLIFLLVIITERSFVNAVRAGGGKAYRHAQEDLERYREERRLRAEERRSYEEEHRIRNIDFSAVSPSPLPQEPIGTAREMTGFDASGADMTDRQGDGEFFAESGGHAESARAQGASDVMRTELSETPGTAENDAAEGHAVSAAQGEGGPSEDSAAAGDGIAPAELPDLSPVLNSGGTVTFAEEDPYLREAFQRAEEIMRRGVPEHTVEAAPAYEAAAAAEGAAEYGQTSAVEAMPEYGQRAADQPISAYGQTPVVGAASAQGYTAAGIQVGSLHFVYEDGEAALEQSDSAEEPSERIIVTAGGKVIQGEYHSVQKRMEEARREARKRQRRDAGFAEDEAEETGETAQQATASMEAVRKEYRFPPLALLEEGRAGAGAGSDLEYRSTAAKLRQTLHSFGVDVTVTNFSRGPAVTRYELLPAQGVKVGRIVALSDDIKLSLAASDIRIEAPIPGKSAVGIEVPNKENNTVYLRALLESDSFRLNRGTLSFAVGKDIGGQTVVTDIAKMPHLLIAGATGSGKSVCINTLIMSILYRYRPEDVKLIMIDPKVVELSVYNGIPHLLIPVVTEPKKAAGALNWAVAEMTDRYKKFASTGVRDLKGYNERIAEAKKSGTVPPEELPQPLSQIIIIIDELADLMMVSKNEVEEAICRIAQLARAAGMHLVIATQRPSVNVITGLIKANIPSRIAFAVSSGVDSRTILDGVGAEKLLGKGDMLFSPQGVPHPMRVQGAFVSDREVQKVVEYIKDEALPLAYSREAVEQIVCGADTASAASGSGRDELFAQAGRFIIEKNKASIGNLQRMFKIGFNRAARIMDQLSAAGVVGDEQGTKPREILMTAEEFEALVRRELIQ